MTRDTILHVLLSEEMGGCERLTIDLAAEFEKRGRRQLVGIFGGKDGPVERDFRKRCIPYRLCTPGPRSDLGLARAVARVVREVRAKTVLTHGFGLHASVALGARLGGARSVFAFGGNPPPAAFRARLATTVRAQIGRLFVTREIACTQHVAGGMSSVYRIPSRRIVVVHNWCDAEAIRRRVDIARTNRPAARGPVLGMVARLDPIKDHETVIRAFVHVRAAYPEAELRLIGEGSLRSILERLAANLGVSDGVTFFGGRDDVPEQLGQFDLFVYATTEAEGFGIVLIEAMAAGIPVVCTEIGPCGEVLDGGRGGWLVPPKDPRSLADTILALWNDPEKRVSLAESAGNLVSERYAVGSAADRILELIDG